ncbi:MAG: universal stress protein [Anaerolineae bacterium]|nr:universal stress protein [Anaerolineae bacterium]
MDTILVQLSEHEWTTQALHLACAIGRHAEARIHLLRLMPVRHLSYLGTPLGDTPIPTEEWQRLKEYGRIAEEYGVDIQLHPMQCVSTLDALVDAAEQLDADVVFAHIPEAALPFWRQLRLWKLERRLKASRRQLFTLERPLNATLEAPFVSIRLIHTEGSK